MIKETGLMNLENLNKGESNMENLVSLEINYDSNEPRISGRDLYEELQIQTPYSMWIKRMLDYGFVENIDYWTDNKKVTRQDGALMPQVQTDHYLTLDMAKEIAMIQRNEIGRKIRKYLIEVEKNWNKPEVVMARALKLANLQIESLKQTNLSLLEENQILLPKAKSFDIVLNTDTYISIKTVADVINIAGIGRNNLIKWFRNKGIFLPGQRVPYRKYIESGHFKVVEVRTPKGFIVNQTLVSQKGLDYVIKLLLEDGFQPRCQLGNLEDWKKALELEKENQKKELMNKEDN